MREFLPPLATYERERLKESIVAHGVKHPILVLKDGRIIDGHHRWEIAEELHISCPHSEPLDLSDDDAFALGVSLNLDRRHLTFEQIKEIREKQKPIYFELRRQGKTQQEVAKLLNVPRPTLARWENDNTTNVQMNNSCNDEMPDLRLSIPKQEYKKIADKYKEGKSQTEIATEYKISQQRVSKVIKIVAARENGPEQTETPPFPNKKYRCLVIDPPWPVQKIEREERPNQGQELDYPTWTLEKISELPIDELVNSDGCHVYLWVTHRFLPEGLKLFEKWNVKYQCVLTWVKPSGMTPFSWMYNTEHVLFGHIGSLELLKKGLKLSFEAQVERHSEKPDVFYKKVREASPEPRLELFTRKSHEGFEPWGNEVENV
jgi:N6-adenosine-specific RNA methylase IME4/DNA-binding transcriptional regulator YiaG